MRGICKLCGLENNLVDSHIIPGFMYKYLFDQKHQIFLTSSKDFKNGELKNKKRNTGVYDGEILCSTCDNEVIGQYETYASKIIYGENISLKIAPVVNAYHNGRGEQWSVCSNIDYKKFKLFLLSILWRASITKRDIFKEVNIGRHEEIIRKMIWEGNPGEETDYPIILMTTANDKNMRKDFIVQPRTVKYNGHKSSRLGDSVTNLLFDHTINRSS